MPFGPTFNRAMSVLVPTRGGQLSFHLLPALDRVSTEVAHITVWVMCRIELSVVCNDIAVFSVFDYFRCVPFVQGLGVYAQCIWVFL